MGKQILIEQLKKEGFLVVYEWHDEPGTVYPLHQHQDKVSFYVTKGSVVFDFQKGGPELVVREGEHIDVPMKTPHTAQVGEDGCDYVIGQMSEDDA